MANRLARYNHLQHYDLTSLRILYTGGSSMGKEAEDLVRKRFPQTSFLQAYGKTRYILPEFDATIIPNVMFLLRYDGTW